MTKQTAQDPIVQVYFRNEEGRITDPSLNLSLDAFAGFLPHVGDVIVDPHTSLGIPQEQSTRGEVWAVVNRVFNPKDRIDHVVLIVERRPPPFSEPWV